MNNFTVMNILDLIESIEANELQKGLSTFSCPLNKEIENFIHEDAIEFAKRKLSITYLLLDNNDGEIVGYFTLPHRATEIKNDNISNIIRRKLSAHARMDSDTNSFTASAFLLAQIGKNYAIDNGIRITGNQLIEFVNDVIADIQRRIGGSIIYLDCEDRKKSKDFYINENHYKIFGERYSNSDDIRYLHMLRFFYIKTARLGLFFVPSFLPILWVIHICILRIKVLYSFEKEGGIWNGRNYTKRP